MSYRYFDLFGTLVPAISVQEYRRTLVEMAQILSVPDQEFVRLWHALSHERTTGMFPTMETILEHLCWRLHSNVDATHIAQAALLRLELMQRALTPRSDALNTLAQLRRMNIPIGLISDCSPDVPLLWSETPFASFIEVPIFSCIVGCKKPNPVIYTYACQKLGALAHECLYVGDGGGRELIGATQMRMQAVLLRVPEEKGGTAHRPDREEWRGLMASSLQEILAFIRITAVEQS
jgi:putative hydrolase of the HAD superfamily